MTITAYAQQRVGGRTRVSVTSSLTGTVYVHWYVDGSWVGGGAVAYHDFFLAPGEQAEILAQDTTDPNYDPIANAPAGYSARRTVWWTASTDTDVSAYRVESNKDGAGWVAFASLAVVTDQWVYSTLSPRLVDLASYQFRVVPVDLAGNDGTPKTVAAEKIVRRPDSPSFSISYSAGTMRVTFAAA